LMGAFDPPTRAHVAVLSAAARSVDAPGAFCMTKVLLDRGDDELLTPRQRLRLLDVLSRSRGFGLVLANRGTYVDADRAMRASGIDATFVIGSDKLEQLADPSFYPDGERGVAATFAEVRLLVVPRPGAEVRRKDVIVLDPAEAFENQAETTISSTEVRRRVRAGESVDAFVPPEVAVGLGGYTAAK
jgi:nicotinic acid mononucleotide adenylyltransferase